MSDVFTPLNDFTWTVLLTIRNATTGTLEAVTTGTVTGFIATSGASDAVTAEATWSVSGVYVGGQSDGEGGTFDAGTWMFQIDAAAITLALCESHFGNNIASPWAIAVRASAIRRVMRLRYQPYYEAVVE